MPWLEPGRRDGDLKRTVDRGADGTMTPQPILNPFALSVDPMERLLLVNFEKDPDSTYIGFEPQWR